MKTKIRVASFLFLFSPLFASNCSAQAVQQNPPERAVINFIVPITPDTVNLLIGIVNQQVRNGTKKITIAIASSGGDPARGFAAYNKISRQR